MNVQYYVDLNNEYDFKAYCTQKSIEVFDAAIAQERFPSRFNLLTLLVSETLSDPFYLAQKLVEIAVHIFHSLSARFEEQRPFSMQGFSNIAGLITIQLCLPFVCTAIRICGTISGFLIPRWAVQSWRIAESGEHLSYLLWSANFKELGNQYLNMPVYEEITPSNALFYLGEKQTHVYLDSHTDYSELKLEIIASFAAFLQAIALSDHLCFSELLEHDFTLGSADAEEEGTQTKKSCIKNRSYYRSSSPEIKQILSKFKSQLPTEEKVNIEELDELQLEEMLKKLSMEELQKLFYHFYFNLHAAFLENDVKKLNQKEIKSYFTQLKDLFSEQFRFGRAHFYQASHSLHCYPRD